MGLRCFIILFLCALIIPVYGQNQEFEDKGIRSDTISNKNFNMLLIPLIFYTPETNFAFGGGGQIFFKTKKSTLNRLNSSMLASGIYTTNKQLTIELKPQVYFNYEKYFLDGKFRYHIFPNSFWGIGQDTPDEAKERYNQTEISFSAAFLKRLSANVNFGFEFNFADYKITETLEGGLLDSGLIEGSDGAKVVSLGFIVNVDRRDNNSSPLAGGYYQFKTNFSPRVLGSSHSFNTYFLDLRKYINMGSNNILALQFYSRLTFGNAPFQAKSYFGGGSVARGYFGGRFIDDHLYLVQIEYRLPIKKRWELAAFALVGNVGSNDSGMGLFDGYKLSYGFGPRYFIYSDRRTLLRLDIGLNKEGDSGIYFGVNEAF